MQILTWNLDGLSEERRDERTEAACLAMLLEDPPDVVCLQEVVPRSWHAHLKHHFGHAGYTAALQPTDGTYFVAILVRGAISEAEVVSLPSQMGRAVLRARLGELLVCTAHLESLASGAVHRRQQAALIAEMMVSHPGPAVFAGDTNLRAGEDALPEEVGDAWVLAGATSAHRYTWDGARNHNIVARGRPPRMRFDRIWVKGLAVDRVVLRGIDALESGVHPSDHFGLVATLR